MRAARDHRRRAGALDRRRRPVAAVAGASRSLLVAANYAVFGAGRIPEETGRAHEPRGARAAGALSRRRLGQLARLDPQGAGAGRGGGRRRARAPAGRAASRAGFADRRRPVRRAAAPARARRAGARFRCSTWWRRSRSCCAPRPPPSRRRGARGPVLVCCALGYSRSAAALATWLMAAVRADRRAHAWLAAAAAISVAAARARRPRIAPPCCQGGIDRSDAAAHAARSPPAVATPNCVAVLRRGGASKCLRASASASPAATRAGRSIGADAALAERQGRAPLERAAQRCHVQRAAGDAAALIAPTWRMCCEALGGASAVTELRPHRHRRARQLARLRARSAPARLFRQSQQPRRLRPDLDGAAAGAPPPDAAGRRRRLLERQPAAPLHRRRGCSAPC